MEESQVIKFAKRLGDVIALSLIVVSPAMLYAVGTHFMYGDPIPAFVIAILHCAAGAILAALFLWVMAVLAMICRMFRRRRLGIIRVDRDGNYYYAKN
jgi:hypothetical protein